MVRGLPWLFVYIVCIQGLLKVSDENEKIEESCRSHYLMGSSSSGIYTIQPREVPKKAIVECIMPERSTEDMDAVVTTIIHSGLERPYQVTESRSVGWQLENYELLSRLIKTTTCRQTIHFNRTEEADSAEYIEESDAGTLTLVSISKTETIVSRGTVELELEGPAAGILHVLPKQAGSSFLPIIYASPLRCEEHVVPHSKEECLIDGGVQFDILKSKDAVPRTLRFAFRTDQSNQELFVGQLGQNMGKVSVQLENDFFIIVTNPDESNGPEQTVLVGHLSDGNWHTVEIAMDASLFSIDNKEIPLYPREDRRNHLILVDVKIDGYVLLTDPIDATNGCGENDLENGRIRLDRKPSLSRPFCTGQLPCECTILSELYQNLPSPTCDINSDTAEALQFTRHSDLLSFLMLPNSLYSKDPIRIALSFKSDSDSGLLFFGEWREKTWGRLQAHYHGNRLSAMYCDQETEESVEECTGCSIENHNGFGNDEWVSIAFFTHEEEHYLVANKEICRLEAASEANSVDTAEMYKTALSHGSILFIGGMFNKKVKSGIYKEDFKAKFFENTREKLPSLRGCVKHVFNNGHVINLVEVFNEQVKSTLHDAQRDKYAVTTGCPSCTPDCPGGVRCRPSTPFEESAPVCSCSDAGMHIETDGTCHDYAQSTALPMAVSSLNAYRGEYSVRGIKGVLSKIWIKMTLPSVSLNQNTPLILFFSHGHRILFRLYITSNDELAIEVAPIEPNNFSADASVKIDIADDRVHLISIEKRTPLGTHPSKRFYEFVVDGSKHRIPDPGMQLTGIEPVPIDIDAAEAGCIRDIGLSYDYDELHEYEKEENKLQQFNVAAGMINEIGLITPGSHHHSSHLHNNTCGVIDPTLWIPSSVKTPPIGRIIEYNPMALASTGTIAENWLWISLALTFVLIVILLLCLCCYLGLNKSSRTNQRKASDDDLERIMGDSPDYPVVRRRVSDRDSYLSDSMDRTDISAYDDVKITKVKVDRESMVSFVDPHSHDNQPRSAIVRRISTPYNDDAPLVDISEMDR